jgi:GDP-mannose transporter
MMVFSSFLAGYNDIMSGSVVKNGSSVFTAYFWMLFNCLSTAYYAVSMKNVISGVGFKDFDTVYYNK